MKNRLKKITLSLSLAIFLGFPATASSQSLTSSQIQQINSGLFRSNYQDWFLQGNRQLEQEVRILLGQLLTSEAKIMEIDQKLPSEICQKELQISVYNFDKISAAQIASVNTKIKDICRHY